MHIMKFGKRILAKLAAEGFKGCLTSSSVKFGINESES